MFCTSLKGTMKLTSPAFSHNGAIPAKYACENDGDDISNDISPALAWSDAPGNTNSFALIVEDPDAPEKTWVHWIVFNMPDTMHELLENTKVGPFLQGATDFDGKQGYGGPCPPSGTHHYHFTLYALDTILDLPAGATKEQLLKAMHGHILEQTTLIGTYKKQSK